MTKADLVEEVTQLGDLTRRDGEVIVDTIFDSVIHALSQATRLRYAALAASVSGSASPGSAAIQKPALRWSSGQARSLLQAQQGITRSRQSQS